MALGIPELGGDNYLSDNERRVLDQEAHILSEQAALQTAQSVELYADISPDGIRQAMPRMSEKQRRKVLKALRLVSHEIAKHANTGELDPPAPDSFEQVSLPEAAEARAPLLLLETPALRADPPEINADALGQEDDSVTVEQASAETAGGVSELPVTREESTAPTVDSGTDDLDKSPQTKTGEEGVLTAVIETDHDRLVEKQGENLEVETNDPKKAPVEFDAERLVHFGQRIKKFWVGGEYPLSDPITPDEAIGLISGRYFEHMKKGKNEILADRLTAILEGRSHHFIAEQESARTGDVVEIYVPNAYKSTAGPQWAVNFLKRLPSVSALETEPATVHEDSVQDSSLPQKPQIAQAIESEAKRLPDIEVPTEFGLEPSVEEGLLSGALDAQTPDQSVAESEVFAPAEQGIHLAPEAEPEVALVPVEDEKPIELSEIQQLIEKQKIEYDPEVADLLIDEMQNDKQPRHRKGLDAKDIAEAHGIHDSVVRRIYSQLLREQKLKGMSDTVKRSRDNGQQSAHYLPQVLYVLLPAVAKEAVRIHGLVISES